jgi:hypothetical protein
MKEVIANNLPMDTPSVTNPEIKAVASEILHLHPKGVPDADR